MHDAHDDEGLIDLRALSVPPRHGAAATSAVFSFASEPPPAPSAAHVLPAEGLSATRRTVGLAAAALCFVVLGCIGVGFAFRGEQAVTPPVVLTNALVAPRPTAAPPAPALSSAPTADPAAASSASSDDDDSGSDPKPKKRGHKAHGSAGLSRSAASSPKPPKAAKASDPCHCHGDFQCTIHCAANFKK